MGHEKPAQAYLTNFEVVKNSTAKALNHTHSYDTIEREQTSPIPQGAFMRKMVLRESAQPNPKKHLSTEERAQLNTIIDLLIPADESFPAPSSLHVLDEILLHLPPEKTCYKLSVLDHNCLQSFLSDLNYSAGGNFCRATPEEQHRLLRLFELRDPAIFQSFWALAYHTYYTRLAMQPTSSPTNTSSSLSIR